MIAGIGRCGGHLQVDAHGPAHFSYRVLGAGVEDVLNVLALIGPRISPGSERGKPLYLSVRIREFVIGWDGGFQYGVSADHL
jgi:hypothetical protein